MARFCGKCGSATREGASFCSKCGNKIAPRPQQAPAGSGAPPGVAPAVYRPGQAAPPAPPPPAAPASAAQPAANPYAPPPPPPPSAVSSIPEGNRPVLAALDESDVERARQVVRRFSLAAAGVVIMPTPFAHLVLLIPVQSAMVIKIARIFGTQDPPEKILAYIAATSGVSVFGQVSALILSSLIPVVGGLVSAPFIYGWTYGLGEVAIRYFQAQGELSEDEMQAVFKEASKKGQKLYKAEKKMSKQESLEELRAHLAPEEYDRLKNKFS